MEYRPGARNVQYTSLPNQHGEVEMYETKYQSPERIYSTPEHAYGFQHMDSEEPLKSKSGAHQGVIRKMGSRLSSFTSAKFGKSKGRPTTKKSWFFFYAGIFMSLLWCAPAITLVVLNITNYVIGASAWCPSGYCPGIPLGSNESLAQLTRKVEHDTHNFIGALQFVAKALEVWFAYIAVTLVYIITSMLARSNHGLPIGYLLTYVEFTDLLSMFKTAHWTSAHVVDGNDPYKKQRVVRKFYIFAGGILLLCVLANLIGPGVAVLLIPTLKWVPTDSVYPERFTGLDGAFPPSGDSAIPYCNATQLAAKDWSCTVSTYSYSLDSMIAYVDSQSMENYLNPGNLSNYVAPPTQELALVLQFNVTALNEKNTSVYSSWAPNRQTIRELSQDQSDYYSNLTNPSSQSSKWSNSLTLNLQRQGPIASVSQTMFVGNRTTTVVDGDREIDCYLDWVYVDLTGHVYAKCFRVGTGWNASSSIGTFQTGTTGSDWPPNWGDPRPVMTRAFFSDKATYQRQTYNAPNWTLPECFANGTLPKDANCDWESIFNGQPGVDIPENYTTQTTNVFLVENTMMNDTSVGFVIESFMTMGFTTYAVDVTNASSSSSYGVVQVQSLPELGKTTPIVMDSSWYLAAWSVNNTADLWYYRLPARLMRNVIENIYEQATGPDSIDWNSWDVFNWGQLGLYTVLQAASMLPYNSTDPATDGLKLATDDVQFPQFAKNAMRQVYAFGIDSRTSVLGLVVTFLGILVAIARAALALFTQVRHREPVELFVAAMKHPHRSEFEGMGDNERKMSAVRFNIDDDQADKIIFSKK